MRDRALSPYCLITAKYDKITCMANWLKEKKFFIAIIIFLAVILIIIFFILKPKTQTIVSDDGEASLEIPKDALPKGVSLRDISIIKISPEEIEGVVTAYRLEPDGLEFKKPVVISVSMGVKKEPMSDGKGNGIRLVQLYHAHSDSLKPLENQKGVVDLGSGEMTVKAPISGFSSVYAAEFHPSVLFEIFGAGKTAAAIGEVEVISEEEPAYFVRSGFKARTTIEHIMEIRAIKLQAKDSSPTAPLSRRLTLIERGAIEDLMVNQGTFSAPTKFPVISPATVEDMPAEFIIKPGELMWTDAPYFTCEKEGGRKLDIMNYGKDFGRIGYMKWNAIFSYKWRENLYIDSPDGKKVLVGQYDDSIATYWDFLIPITCLPLPRYIGDSPSSKSPSVSPNPDPEPPGAPPAPVDPKEAQCKVICGTDRYSPATSQQACSDTSRDFLCIQNKQACYDYLIPKGWQNDSNCCCKDAPVARPAGGRIDCSKFIGWDANGFAIEKNPKYPFSSSTLPPAECK